MDEEDRLSARRAIARMRDWSALPVLAAAHGVSALVHQHAAAGSLTGMPLETVETLRGHATRQAARNMSLARELRSLLLLLGRHRIQAVPLKGPMLAELLYGSTSLRKILDLDIFVHEREIPRIVDLLRSLGYREPRKIAPILNRPGAHGGHHVALVQSGSGILVELHYNLVAEPLFKRTTLDAVLDRTVAAAFMDVPVRALRPEDLLVYLCEHGSSHAWQRLEWACGVAELLRSGRVRDWDGVRAFADMMNGHDRVEAGLRIAADLLGAPVPIEMYGRRAGARKAAESVVARFRRDPSLMPGTADAFLFRLRTEGRMLSVAGRIWMTLFTPKSADVRSAALPAGFRGGYYALRPVRLFARHARRWLGKRAGAPPGRSRASR